MRENSLLIVSNEHQLQSKAPAIIVLGMNHLRILPLCVFPINHLN